MRSRWSRFLPGWPAALLVPAVLAYWAVLCFVPPAYVGVGEYWVLESTNGFPFEYTVPGVDIDPTGGVTVTFYIDILWELLVLDAVLAATAAWFFALAVDRFILHPIRAARMKKHGLGEGSPPLIPRPKAALFSLRTMMVMYCVLSVFVWANVRDRIHEMIGPSQGADGVPGIEKENRRGFPWTYSTEWLETLAPDDSGGLVLRDRSGTFRPVSVEMGPLLLDLAFALAVSIGFALASERFVFSRMRRSYENGGPRG